MWSRRFRLLAGPQGPVGSGFAACCYVGQGFCPAAGLPPGVVWDADAPGETARTRLFRLCDTARRRARKGTKTTRAAGSFSPRPGGFSMVPPGFRPASGAQRHTRTLALIRQFVPPRAPAGRGSIEAQRARPFSNRPQVDNLPHKTRGVSPPQATPGRSPAAARKGCPTALLPAAAQRAVQLEPRKPIHRAAGAPASIAPETGSARRRGLADNCPTQPWYRRVDNFTASCKASTNSSCCFRCCRFRSWSISESETSRNAFWIVFW